MCQIKKKAKSEELPNQINKLLKNLCQSHRMDQCGKRKIEKWIEGTLGKTFGSH